MREHRRPDPAGESLREAFGPPRRYARQWGRHSRQGWARTAAFSLVALVGATALGRGALALGQGVPAVFGLPAGWVALVGLVLAAGATGLFDYDPVRNPLTGAVPRPGRRGFALLAIALWIGEGVVCFLLGLALVPA